MVKMGAGGRVNIREASVSIQGTYSAELIEFTDHSQDVLLLQRRKKANLNQIFEYLPCYLHHLRKSLQVGREGSSKHVWQVFLR